jgi:hypothetical protein
MIERLHNVAGAFGFKASGTITPDDIKGIEPQIDQEIHAAHKHPIGILIDLTALQPWNGRRAGKNYAFCTSSADRSLASL